MPIDFSYFALSQNKNLILKRPHTKIVMYLVVIAWIYVVLMMSVAEATNSNGTLLGAIITFFLYGVAPVALVIYLMRTPARRQAIKAREAEELANYASKSTTPEALAEATSSDKDGPTINTTTSIAP